MNKNKQGAIVLTLSLPLCALTAIVSSVGILAPGFYAAETINWQAQSIAQDMINLFLAAPCLLITSVVAYRNNRTATMIWGGTVLYLAYTFTIYCFDVHFNRLFILYCFCLGLSVYAFIYFLFICAKEKNGYHFENKLIFRVIGIYFLVISTLFYGLWLSEIGPAIIQNTIPASLVETGLSTNGVQVIDLAVFLPGIFITGIFLLKGRSFGLLLAPVLLSFFILMDITIGFLVIIMKMKGVTAGIAVAAVMGVLAFMSLILLILFFKAVKR